MSTRVQARINAGLSTRIDLPTGSRPQYVDQLGYESSYPSGRGLGTEAESGKVEEEVEVDTQKLVALGEEQGAPLLSIAESLVLPYSLIHTRQHHLRHLLPHIFSHPPLPSHAKPRARPLPRGIFSYPTPPLPDLPLPYREYHGPQQSNTTSKPSFTPPVDAASTPPPETLKDRDKENSAPAHEIDCIGRVTLSIGPISYPDTEVWVCRWVESRGIAVKRKKPQGTGSGSGTGAAQVKKSRLTLEDPTKRQKVIPGFKPASTTSYRPASTLASGPPPPSVVPKSNIPPVLLERVNKAATTHPWLSTIIHRAAKHEATREELAKLGRVVGRLGRGEDVGEGPDDGLSRPIGMGVNAVAGPSRPGPVLSPVTAEQDPDDEVDMTGPKQVGGGPITSDGPADSASLKPAKPARKTSPVKPARPATTKPIPTTQQSTSNSSDTIKKPPLSTPVPPIPRVHASSTPLQSMRPPQTAFPALQNTIPAMPPPVICPIHKPPPPFLLIAFKETPTEKYLIPLGSQSYISRIGGDYVTGPAPPWAAPAAPAVVINQAVPVTAPTTLPLPEDINSTPDPIETPPLEGSVKGKNRTRKSFGRNAKLAVIDTAITPAETATVDGPPVSATETPVPLLPSLVKTRPELPALPGMKPIPSVVLLSTVVPCSEWVKPDWENLSKGMPWGNSAFGKSVIKQEFNPNYPTGVSEAKTPDLVNVAAESFLPNEGVLQAVTMRFEDVDDGLWRRMKGVIDEVERGEMKALSAKRPDLLEIIAPPGPPHPNPNAIIPSTSTVPNMRPPAPPFTPSSHPRLREFYAQNKRQRFSTLLKRVSPRKFLHLRLPTVSQPLTEATSDKWAPRPYSISTKPLYLASPPSHPVPLPLAPVAKRRGEKEGEVEFEMPVSLELLDERVEEGAKKAVGKRVGKLKGRGSSSGVVEGFDTLGRRKHGIRAVKGKVCEGCGSSRLKVWRRGPGGTATLCNGCGDKFAEGTLGELKAPGVIAVEDGDLNKEGPDPETQRGQELEVDVSVKAEMVVEVVGSVATPSAADNTIGEPASGTKEPNSPLPTGDAMAPHLEVVPDQDGGIPSRG